MLASASFLQAQTLTSDQADYSPGTTATLTGSGFQAGETVVVQVLHYDGTSDGGEDHQPWEVIADENGNFTTTWHVCEDDCVGSLLKATADGQTSGLHAETTFTDAIHITSISLTSGSTNGGTLVTITGNGLNNNLTYQVAFGTTTVPGTWVDNQHITATTPAHIAGQVTVMVTATASNGNTSSDFINNAYTYVCATITATAVITQAKCHGDDASVTVTATGGTGAYTGTGTFPLADGTSSTYTVSDANGCSGVSNSVKANSPSQVVATAVITQALCHGGDASVTVSATGGTGAYTGTGTFSLADGTSSTYIVHDANNCAATSNSVTATSPSQVVATALITQALCHGDPASVTVTATGGTGAYTGTGTFSLADGTSSTYTVHDANNCAATSNSVTANSPSQVVAIAVITQALCHGDPASVTVTATGGTGAYTGTGTFSLADGTSASYTVHDANNCAATSNSVTATSPSQVVTTAVITQALCHGDPASVTVTATGGTGAYTGTGTFSLADGQSATYIVKDANNCSDESNSVTATSPSAVVATAVITQALCHGGDASVTVTATGGTGAYTGTGTFSLADGISSSYTVHDANNCAATSNSVTANSPSQVVATAVITQALCHGGDASVTVSATGGTGAYIGTGTFSLADGTSSTYIVHDANNCAATSNSVTASSPSQVVATAVITQALCHGDPSSVTVSATGGTGAYTGTGTFSLADGTSSTYTVHDANNCSATSNSVTASSPSQVVATAVITQAKCHGDDASVTVTATGGTGAYTGTGTFSLADGTSSTYTVHDANNCAATSNSVTASNPSQVVATAVITQALCHGDPSSVTVSATGGTGAYTGTGTFSLADGTSSSYTVHDANNCAATSNSVTAGSPLSINPHCSINNPQLYFGYTGDQSATVKSAPTGGVGPYTITIKMTRPLLCNQITSAGDEIWTPGANTNSSTGIVTCPTSGGPTVGSEPSSTSNPVSSYSVNVTLMKDALFHITVVDANGCKAECDTALSAEDVRCFAGNSSIKKYTICHQTGNSKSPCVSICVDSSALAEHMAHGDFIGACPKNGCSPAISSSSSSSVSIATIPASKAFNVKIMNNPSFGGTEFKLTVGGDAKEPVNISVTDMYGQRVFTTKGTANDTYRFGTGFSSGTYIVQVMQGKDIKTYKVVKGKG